VAQTVPIIAVLAALLAAPPSLRAADEEIRHEVYASFAASTVSALTSTTNMPGFAVGYEIVPWRYLLVGAAGGYQAPAKVNNRGLVYDLSVAEGMVYVGGRVSLDRLRGRRADDDPSLGAQFLGANEFAVGATLGLAHYIQEVRGEAERRATQPFAGIFVCWNIWFMDWMGLHFNAMFHWSLTDLIPGKGGLLRKEIHLGPTFRF
jgi:hypothetical protein